MRKSKLMLALDPSVIKRLQPWMKGIKLQELIRAKIIPDWERFQLGTLERNAYRKGYQKAKMKYNGRSPRSKRLS